ncbi:MAG: DUF420 domain-containing protein [Planctomycetes bacterium]|nr:DUF420 domain-containing protein [Planctomycetota bacterium]
MSSELPASAGSSEPPRGPAARDAARPAPGRPARWSQALLSLIILGAFGVILAVALGPRRARLPVLGAVPAFVLTGPDGRPFDSRSLEGKVWVANFIFTHCGDTCPRMTAQMHRLQVALKASGSLSGAVRLVSFSVDPERDVPEVLDGYLARFGADRALWTFLTGDGDAIARLCREGFRLPLGVAGTTHEPLDASDLAHSDRFVLVDAAGRVRGSYSPISEDGEEELRRLLAGVAALAAEAAGGGAGAGAGSGAGRRWFEGLPHLNVLLNASSAVLLAAGYLAIRSRRERLHARLMLSAFASSTLFLASYLTYHYLAGHRAYGGQGALRVVYLAVLFSHIALAFATVPLALATLVLALRKRFERHRRVARWALPVWLYVSVTGVVVYLMLYVF